MKRKISVILMMFFIIILFSVETFANNELDINKVDLEKNIYMHSTSVCGISIFFVIIGGIISKRKYVQFKNKKIYYPSDEVGIIELEYFLKEKITMKTLMTLLLHFANKGYVKFEEYYEVSSDSDFKQLQISTKKLKIVKLTEYEGNSNIERAYFNKIFSLQNEIDLDLNENRIHINNSIDEMCKNVNSTLNEQKIYSKDSKKGIIKIYLIIGLILTLVISAAGIDDSLLNSLPVIIILVSIFMLLLLGFNLLFNSKKIRYQAKMLLLILISFLIFFISFFVCIGINNVIGENIYAKTCYIISVICLLILNIFIITFSKKNKSAYKAENEIKNYRNTLAKIDENKVQELINHDEKYFYNTLPYAYMLNIEKKFIEKFGYLIKEKPEWFISPEDYNSYECNMIIINKMEELISFYDEKVWEKLV